MDKWFVVCSVCSIFDLCFLESNRSNLITEEQARCSNDEGNYHRVCVCIRPHDLWILLLHDGVGPHVSKYSGSLNKALSVGVKAHG